MAWSPSQRLASSGSDGRIKLWKSDGRPDGELARIGDWTYSVVFDHRGKLLFGGAWTGRIHLFDVDTRKPLPGFQVQ